MRCARVCAGWVYNPGSGIDEDLAGVRRNGHAQGVRGSFGADRETAKLNGIDPQAWLTNVLGRIADHKITRLDEFCHWRYAAEAA